MCIRDRYGCHRLHEHHTTGIMVRFKVFLSDKTVLNLRKWKGEMTHWQYQRESKAENGEKIPTKALIFVFIHGYL